jgi:hypothetical protein
VTIVRESKHSATNGREGKKEEKGKHVDRVPFQQLLRRLVSLSGVQLRDWLQRNGKRKWWCTGGSIQWTPAELLHGMPLAISASTHTHRTTADGSRCWRREREGGQRRPDGRWARWLRKSAFCGTNADTEG